jgi:hypothetical protein
MCQYVRVGDFPSQTRLIEYKGIDNVTDLAIYTDAEIDI